MITLHLTQKQAEQLDLVRCSCGHRKNNHFMECPTREGHCPCAHCECKNYKQVVKLPLPPDVD